MGANHDGRRGSDDFGREAPVGARRLDREREPSRGRSRTPPGLPPDGIRAEDARPHVEADPGTVHREATPKVRHFSIRSLETGLTLTNSEIPIRLLDQLVEEGLVSDASPEDRKDRLLRSQEKDHPPKIRKPRLARAFSESDRQRRRRARRAKKVKDS